MKRDCEEEAISSESDGAKERDPMMKESIWIRKPGKRSKAVAYAVRNETTTARITRLAERLQDLVPKSSEEKIENMAQRKDEQSEKASEPHMDNYRRS